MRMLPLQEGLFKAAMRVSMRCIADSRKFLLALGLFALACGVGLGLWLTPASPVRWRVRWAARRSLPAT